MDSQQLLLGIGGDQATQIQRIESLVDRHVDGLIVLPAWGAYLSEELEHYASTLPIVQVGGRRCSFRTSMVSIDENAAMEIVIRHLAERGIASVAYMAGKEISFESAELFAMFHTQVRAHHLNTEAEWNKFGDRSVQRGFDCAMRLFSEPLVQPEAVVCADDAIAFGVMVALHSLGLHVPQDVLVVGYNDSPIARTTMPALTSVRPPFKQIVSEALRLLNDAPGSPAHISLAPQLIVRESTNCQR